MRQKRKPPPDGGLKKPKKHFDDTASGEQALLDWLSEQGAVESISFDEETGLPMRTFTIDLKK